MANPASEWDRVRFHAEHIARRDHVPMELALQYAKDYVAQADREAGLRASVSCQGERAETFSNRLEAILGPLSGIRV